MGTDTRFEDIRTKTREACLTYREKFQAGGFTKTSDAAGGAALPACELRWAQEFDAASLADTEYGSYCQLDGLCPVAYNNDVDTDGLFHSERRSGYGDVETDIAGASGAGVEEGPLMPGCCGNDDRCQRHGAAWEQMCVALKLITYELRRIHRALRFHDVAISCALNNAYNLTVPVLTFASNTGYTSDGDLDGATLRQLESFLASNDAGSIRGHFVAGGVNTSVTENYLTNPTFDKIEYLIDASLMQDIRSKF